MLVPWQIFYASYIILFHIKILLKDTLRKKAPSNKTLALRKSTTIGVWAVRTLNQLFIRKFLNWNKTFKKIEKLMAKLHISVLDPLCSYHSIYFNIGFWYGSVVWKWCFFNLSAFNKKINNCPNNLSKLLESCLWKSLFLSTDDFSLFLRNFLLFSVILTEVLVGRKICHCL